MTNEAGVGGVCQHLHLMGVVDEHVPLAVDALGCVEVVGGPVEPDGVVQVNGLLNECLGVCRIVRPARSRLIPARTEYQTVVYHAPGVLGLHGARSGVRVGVTGPFTILIRQCKHQFTCGEVVRPNGRGSRMADKVGIGGVGQHFHFVRVVDEHVPLAVDALRRVVMVNGGIQPFFVIHGDGLFHEVPGVVLHFVSRGCVLGIRFLGWVHVRLLGLRQVRQVPQVPVEQSFQQRKFQQQFQESRDRGGIQGGEAVSRTSRSGAGRSGIARRSLGSC